MDKKSSNDLAKLSVLLDVCKGDAQAALDLIARTPAGYQLALQRLKSLFNDPYAIRNELVNRLDNLEKASENSGSLMRTLTTLQTIVARLTSIGDKLDSAFIQRKLLDKFP